MWRVFKNLLNHDDVAAVLSAATKLRTSRSDDLVRVASELCWNSRAGWSRVRTARAAFPLVVEAVRRVFGIEYHEEQVLAGLHMLHDSVVEMQTGEGKTLAALFPAFLHALSGNGCHVMTANDYLARRDGDAAASVLQLLGISVGVIETGATPEDRRRAYGCDVTYGTAREFGFDYLRDRIDAGPSGSAAGPHGGVQRRLYAAVVDEADSIMVDQACTPLIISAPARAPQHQAELLKWADLCAGVLVADDEYSVDRARRRIRLTESGRRKVLLASRPAVIDALRTRQVVDSVERAVAARAMYQRDRDYVVLDGKVQIVDESTGRMLEGRRWQDGLQEAIELKENLEFSRQTREAGSISMQRFLRQYQSLCGMTGTATAVRRELQRVYQLDVVAVAPHRPRRVVQYPPRVMATEVAKWNFVATQVRDTVTAGRAVLIGTPSIAASERVGTALNAAGIKYELLHARHDAREAEIIAQAGQAGRVTIATNMAGRGTDIPVPQDVLQAGGLHVIATELHSSSRIDRQLVGRTGRQGCPGSFQLVVSLEDELLETLPQTDRQRLRSGARPDHNGSVPTRLLKVLVAAQTRLEQQAERQRLQMLRREQQREDACRRVGLEPSLEFL